MIFEWSVGLMVERLKAGLVKKKLILLSLNEGKKKNIYGWFKKR